MCEWCGYTKPKLFWANIICNLIAFYTFHVIFLGHICICAKVCQIRQIHQLFVLHLWCSAGKVVGIFVQVVRLTKAEKFSFAYTVTQSFCRNFLVIFSSENCSGRIVSITQWKQKSPAPSSAAAASFNHNLISCEFHSRVRMIAGGVLLLWFADKRGTRAHPCYRLLVSQNLISLDCWQKRNMFGESSTWDTADTRRSKIFYTNISQKPQNFGKNQLLITHRFVLWLSLFYILWLGGFNCRDFCIPKIELSNIRLYN